MKVGITGLGAVTCLGASVEELWQNVLREQSGISEDGLGRVPMQGENRALEFCLSAAREAMSQARWQGLGPQDGLIMATTTGQMLMWDHAFIDLIHGRVKPSAFRERFVHQPLGELNAALCRALSFAGPTSLLTSACSAATQALGLAAMWIRQGRVKRCLVVGVEVLCDLTCEGFRSLQLLSRAPARPFDVNRRGINLAEGAAVLCLEGDPQAPLAWLSGFGFSTDGYHMTGPHPEGQGSLRAMQNALQIGGLKPEQIDWVYAHGTGSAQNDLAEGCAIASLFGENPWVSSTKSLHGHALAASGTIEAALLVRAMGAGRVLHTRGLVDADPAIPVRHPWHDREEPIAHALKNTLGFGGTNAALVISHPEAP